MYLRLAFAVAAHFEPEILILDEVLAVGDAPFRAKCLTKMREISRDGRTVFFVSHDMKSVTTLCDRALLIESGRLIDDGDPKSVTADYLKALSAMVAATPPVGLASASEGSAD
jgi:lipopolysaccharide transport system ATP-binding protein